jgi:hypothetical protein
VAATVTMALGEYSGCSSLDDSPEWATVDVVLKDYEY